MLPGRRGSTACRSCADVVELVESGAMLPRLRRESVARILPQEDPRLVAATAGSAVAHAPAAAFAEGSPLAARDGRRAAFAGAGPVGAAHLGALALSRRRAQERGGLREQAGRPRRPPKSTSGAASNLVAPLLLTNIASGVDAAPAGQGAAAAAGTARRRGEHRLCGRAVRLDGATQGQSAGRRAARPGHRAAAALHDARAARTTSSTSPTPRCSELLGLEGVGAGQRQRAGRASSGRRAAAPSVGRLAGGQPQAAPLDGRLEPARVVGRLRHILGHRDRACRRRRGRRRRGRQSWCG